MPYSPCTFITSCTIINFSFDFRAVHLLSPARLLILAVTPLRYIYYPPTFIRDPRVYDYFHTFFSHLFSPSSGSAFIFNIFQIHIFEIFYFKSIYYISQFTEVTLLKIIFSNFSKTLNSNVAKCIFNIASNKITMINSRLVWILQS